MPIFCILQLLVLPSVMVMGLEFLLERTAEKYQMSIGKLY